MDSLYLIYKGESSDTLYTTYFDGTTWCGDVKISQEVGKTIQEVGGVSQEVAGISPESNYNPGVAVYNNRLYLVYKGEDSNTLYTAYFDGNRWYGNAKISDQPGKISPESNYNPGFAVYNNRLYLVYKGEGSNTLYTAYFDGTRWYGNEKISDQPGKISPESDYNPGVAVYDNRLYLVYKGEGSNTLYTAYFDGTKWYGNDKISDQPGGISPESNYNPGVAVFTMITRPNWMSNNLATLGPAPLLTVVMPASHDAGMYTLQECTIPAGPCNTRNQTKSIFWQLQSGIRYFDIRPVLYNKTMYTGHYSEILGFRGCLGPTISQIFSDVASFMEISNDLVLLKFSHYYDRDKGSAGFSDDQMNELCSLIVTGLKPLPLIDARVKPLLYTRASASTNLAITSFNEFIADGGKVLPLLDSLKPEIQSKYTGIYSYADFEPGKSVSANMLVYDKFSDTDDLNTMISDQFTKLRNPANHVANLFLLSWTLTQNEAQALACGAGLAPWVLDLASEANNALWSTITTTYKDQTPPVYLLPNLIYVDNCGVFVTDLAIWLNEKAGRALRD
jgi:hypothetical protein